MNDDKCTRNSFALGSIMVARQDSNPWLWMTAPAFRIWYACAHTTQTPPTHHIIVASTPQKSSYSCQIDLWEPAAVWQEDGQVACAPSAYQRNNQFADWCVMQSFHMNGVKPQYLGVLQNGHIWETLIFEIETGGTKEGERGRGDYKIERREARGHSSMPLWCCSEASSP